MAIGQVEQIDLTNAMLRSKMREGKTFDKAVRELEEAMKKDFKEAMDAWLKEKE